MKLVVAGGSGFIGRSLCRELVQRNHQVTVLARHPQQAAALLDPGVTTIGWDGLSRGAWERALDGADAVVNLAGESIAGGRWTQDRKEILRNSRIGPTRILVQALGTLSTRPRTLVNSSAIGYYGISDDRPLREESQPGSGFLADLCVAWEQEALKAEGLGLRVVRLRTGMVLGQQGGALPRMLPPFRMFLGGPVSPGTQWVSWIHHQDLAGIVQWALVNDRAQGPINGVAPEAVTMREFCRVLGKVLGRPSWLPVPEFALKLALGELATLLTTGQRVEPAAAQRGGFIFRFPALEQALADLLRTPARAPTRG